MTRQTSAAALSLLCLSWGLTASAASPPPISAPIAIDGSLNDWEQVRLSPTTSARDGEGFSIPCAYSVDLDCSVGSGGDDLSRFSWTWSSSYFFYCFERYTSSAPWAYFHLYLDTDNDGLMETGEPVVTVRLNSPGTSSSTTLGTYTAFLPAGDSLADPAGKADGHDMPGSVGGSCCPAFEGPVAGGLAFEGGFSWLDLGLTPFSAMGFHVATSSNSNVPNSLVDNMGGFDGNAGSTGWRALDLRPDVELSTTTGVPVRMPHVACNEGNLPARLEVRGISAQGRTISWYTDPDRDGAPDLKVATDAGGDGDFSRASDDLRIEGDSDGNGRLDFGVVAGGTCLGFVAEETFPNNAGDSTERVVIDVHHVEDPSVTDEVNDTIHVGRITMHPDVAATVTAGGTAHLVHQVQNNLTTAERVDLQVVTSTLGWSWTMLLDPSGDGNPTDAVAVTDTDNSGLPDIGLLPGEMAVVIARVTAPLSATPGQVENATLRASLRGAVRGTVQDTVTLARAVTFVPDHVAPGGERYGAAGGSLWFDHRLSNASALNSTYSLTVTSDAGWLGAVFADPDCDGLPYDAEALGANTPLVFANGGETCLLLRADIPPGTPNRQSSRYSLRVVSNRDGVSSDEVHDEAVAAIVRTYSDAQHLVSTTTPPPCTSLHAVASGLPASATNLRFVWRDPAGVAVRVTNTASNVAGECSDMLALQPGDLGPGFSVDIQSFDGVTWNTQDSMPFDVLDRVQLRSLTTSGPRFNVTGQSLAATATLFNSSPDQRADNTYLRWLVVSSDLTQYLKADGTFAPFTGLESTQVDNIPRLNPLETKNRNVSIADVTYPSPGLYAVRLYQSASCGGEYLAREVVVEVVEDADFDGLSDSEELAAGTDSHDADTDDDGLQDGTDGLTDSDGNGTIDALQCDADGDGLPDGLEAGIWDPGPDTNLATSCFLADTWPGTTTNPDAADTDGGGIPDGAEDTDHDGRVDGGETDPNIATDDLTYDGDGDTVSDRDERDRGMDPNDADSDDDGRPDGTESGRDSDGDGLDDAAECDSDGDGLSDGLEAGLALPAPGTNVAAGCFVPDADPVTTTDPTRADTDGGGVPDGVEDVNHDGQIQPNETDPNDPLDDDPDADGLDNGAEDALGTSRTDRDTDDDGVNDLAEGAGDADGDTLPDALECDSDGDLLPDGLELGLTSPDAGTDLASACFVPDADPSTATDPHAADTDGGGLADGLEDTNRNGAFDSGERDPNEPLDDGSCSRAAPPELSGLHVAKLGASGVRLTWDGLLDACVTYDAWSSDALPALTSVATGVLVPQADVTPAAGPRVLFFVVSATSALGGAGPTGL